MIKKLSLLILIMIVIITNFLTSYAQEAIPAAGANASGSNGSVSYTIGQVVYTTEFGPNGSEAKGVQQPYEISIITSVESNNSQNIECVIYPNPASNFLTLKFEIGRASCRERV